MIDTHAHLDFPEFDQDRKEVIRRAFDNGLKAIINVGVDLERSRKSIEIAEKHEGVFASVGLHPKYFSKAKLSDTLKLSFRIDELRKLARNKKVVAVGECGLDYFHGTWNIEHGTEELERIKHNQKKGFLAQIKLARELRLPVILHCRDAWGELFGIVSRYEFRVTKFVLHCYSGEKKDTDKFLELPNIYFSFSGNITYPKPTERAERLAGAVRMIPLDKIMLDSDAPFLAPQDRRGKRNEPIFVKYIAKKIAEVKEVGEEEVENATDENAIKFFCLS